MLEEHAGDFTISPEGSRYGHVQFRWHCVRRIVKAQSSLIAEDSLSGLSRFLDQSDQSIRSGRSPLGKLASK
jgi:hypothetical protein